MAQLRSEIQLFLFLLVASGTAFRTTVGYVFLSHREPVRYPLFMGKHIIICGGNPEQLKIPSPSIRWTPLAWFSLPILFPYPFAKDFAPG